ncbi:MAG: S9 family peptidase [Krumholzibacteria bacterium]|nr:S9 family peptidase [Candidatus Krumholzibacteria bacterium]
MRRIPTIAAAALAAVLLTTLAAGPAAAAGITPAQLLDLEELRSAAVSPDGKLAAYTVAVNRSRDDEPGGPWSRLWVVATDGGQPRPFVTGEVTVGTPSFSPDGRFLGFTMKRGGKDAKTQVWAIAVDGGEARPVTKSPTGVAGWSWSHDGAAVLYIDTDEGPADEKKLKDKGWLPRYYEEDLRGRDLRRAPFGFGGEPQDGEVLVDGLSVWGLDAGADGRTVVFGASELNLVDHQYMFQDIHVLDLVTGEHRVAVDVPGKLGDYRISPDGKRLAWTAAASRSDHAVSSLFLGTPDGSLQANITPAGFAGHLRHVAWRDAKTLLVQADEGVTTTAYLVDVSGKEPKFRRILEGGAHGLVFGMPAAQRGAQTMVAVGHSGDMPAELYAWAGKGAPRRLTRHNPALAEVELGEQRVVRWTARDGLELEGILMLPVAWDGRPAPLVVDVHGGPESNERNGWLSRYASPGQAMCAKGYAVFFPNYRGSTGRGVEFAALAFGDPAGAEFDDIVDGVDHLVAEGIADKDRVGVMGGSYGGYATNWLVTRYSDRFKAGVGFVGVSDLVSKRFLTDIPYEDEYVHMGAPVRETWDLMRERSPVFHAENCRTPLLLLHGDSDPRVHPSQSQELYRALKMAGHPSVRLVYYPGEGHGNAKRFGREDALHRTMAWFDHYLLDGAAWDGPMPELDLSGEMELLKKE